MNKAIAWVWVVAAFLLSACSSTHFNQTQTSPTLETPSPVADLPHCQGELPRELEATVAGYRLAQESDFIPAIQSFRPGYTAEIFTCSIFTTDFDQDGSTDYALLLVNEETANFQVRFALNQGDDDFNSIVVQEYERVTEPSEGVVYTSMSFKPAGSEDLALREYSPLEPDEREAYVERSAIALWQAINTDSAGLPTDITDLSGLGYCSNAFYFVNGNLETFEVCD